MIDLGAALDAAPATTAGPVRCKIGRMLDTIPDDTPRRPELVAAFETPGVPGPGERPPGYRRNVDLVRIAAALGVSTSSRSASDHRSRACRCYLGPSA